MKQDLLYALNWAYENGNNPEGASKWYDVVYASTCNIEDDDNIVFGALGVLQPLEGLNPRVDDVISILETAKARLCSLYYYGCEGYC